MNLQTLTRPLRAHLRGALTVTAAIVLTSVLTPAAGAQSTDESTLVTIGKEYAAGGGKRFWLGSGYRDLWTTPVRLPILDLKTEAGGLKPVRQVGQNQSLGLAMTGADGRAYTFRSLHKEADRMLPEALRGSLAGVVIRDLTSGTHPAAGVILPTLAEAAGVPHTSPRLVMMPNDPALGEFAATFGNQAGTIEEFPLPAGAGNPGFMGATEIVSSTEMWTRWMAGPENGVDSLAYLRARVLDLWVDNYDRHRGQWRWMKLPGKDLWQPLPEDPDFVLIHRDGFLARQIRSRVPMYLEFAEHFPKRLDGALLNSAEMDRWIMAGLLASDFEQMARELQSRFTDDVIERALRRMPAEWYAKSGDATAAALRARRSELVNYLLRIYRYYAEVVDLHATDRNERVSIERAADGSIEVTLGLADASAAPYYRRRFLPSETGEVRIFLHGGDDRVVRTGASGGPVTVRVIAGGGHDVIDDSKSGSTDVWRDAGTIDVVRGSGTDVRNDVWPNPLPVKDAPWIEPRSYGAWTVPAPAAGYAPDVLVYLGYGFTRTTWGFRTEPAKSVQTLRGAVATGTRTGRVEYDGTFRRPASHIAYELRTFASGLERYNYFGTGNETPESDDRERYQTRQQVFSLTPTVRYEIGRRLDAFVGPEVRYSQTPADETTIVAEQAPAGVGDYGRLALRAGVEYDSRQASRVAPRADYTVSFLSGGALSATGIQVQASGYIAPAIWDTTSSHGGLEGFVATYVGNERTLLSIRVGGQTVQGDDYPWFDAAHVGGENNRGYRSHRFAGDSSLSGSVAVRSWFGASGSSQVPLRLGGIAFSDVGRVWVDGETSSRWHPSFGGGLLAQVLGTAVTAHAIGAYGNEGVRVYMGLGYPF